MARSVGIIPCLVLSSKGSLKRLRNLMRIWLRAGWLMPSLREALETLFSSIKTKKMRSSLVSILCINLYIYYKLIAIVFFAKVLYHRATKKIE